MLIYLRQSNEMPQVGPKARWGGGGVNKVTAEVLARDVRLDKCRRDVGAKCSDVLSVSLRKRFVRIGYGGCRVDGKQKTTSARSRSRARRASRCGVIVRY